jgi:hypothetical protein
MWALVALLVTGALMVIGEPVRELVTFSFWFKMSWSRWALWSLRFS